MKEQGQLINAKWVITCEENNRVLEDHTVVISNKNILAILPAEEAKRQYSDWPEQHYGNHALLPGFINAHTHLSMNLLRGYADDLELMDWLNNFIWPAEQKFTTAEFVYDGSLLAIAELIRGGTTCFNDMYFYPEMVAEAALKAGIRAHIGLSVINVPTRWAQNIDECFAVNEQIYSQYKNRELIGFTLAPQGTYTVDKAGLLRVKEMADEYKLKINIHLQESVAEVQKSLRETQKRPLHILYDLGLTSPNLIAIHMSQINDEDIVILTETKTHIVHCPECNMKLASGACPIDQLSQLGVNIALGTDGAASNNDLDMLSEIRAATFLAKLTAKNPKALPAEKALQMATLNGAKALGVDHVTGSLTPGKSADMIAIDLDQIETQPLYNPVSQIVYAASRNQITDVWVAGRQLLKNRQLTTLDEQALLEIARKWRKKIKI